MDGVAAAMSAFREAERRAATKISALVGGPDHAGDGAVPPAHHTNEGTGNGGHGGERELTAAERKQIQDEHIRKANDPDRTWFKEHYDKLGRRRHLLNTDGTTKLVDGVELPSWPRTLEALEKGKLQYVLVKANDHAGTSYAGAVLEHFKIY
ncbi:hypothetical protein [Streptomyces sp. NPDC088358]|uniref:hypothetical protein n=1 Tax=Streptomyces sp. NPDC088358 TaxID=3365857 RepID=UPI0038077863